MPEIHDKHGRPKLWATIKCLVPECCGTKLVGPERAEPIAMRLSEGYGLRYLLARLKCGRCGFRNASLTFHLAHEGRQPWHDRKAPGEGRRIFPHEGNGAILDDGMSRMHRDLPVLVKGRGSQRKTK